jgi:hypothetical protein
MGHWDISLVDPLQMADGCSESLIRETKKGRRNGGAIGGGFAGEFSSP